MKKLFIKFGASLAPFAPLVALAAPSAEFSEAKGYLGGLTDFINTTIIPLIFVVGIVVFIFGMYLYFIQGGADDEKRNKGKQLLLWSLIGFVLMISVVGIINLLGNSAGFTGDTELPTPTIDINVGGTAGGGGE